MGFMSRKVLPACGHMCVCCPAMRSRSRQPVKRYKKLLADIFPKSPDGSPNERKIVKLCEYAVKNPFRIPKIAQHLEQRIYKELRNEHIKFITVAMEAYNKILCICKQHMPYFAASLLNVVEELMDTTNHDNLWILGSQTLTRFIYCQVDVTYVHNIELLVPKVCKMAREAGDENNKRRLRASSLQCLSSMVWFMAKFSHVFTGFDDIVHVTLDNYEPDACLVDADESGETHHNWVDEVVRSETRGASGDVSPSYMVFRPRPEKKDPNLLTREEIDTPKVWAQICIQQMAELAKESTAIRRVLDPMFIYFDTKRHWVPQQGLAVYVLSDMFYLMEGSGNEQSIFSALIRHLDHKNVAYDLQVKSNIIRIVGALARQFRSKAIIVEIGFLTDLCRHLRKSLQASFASLEEQESTLNSSLQNSIEDCLLEMARWVGDAQPLFDIMTLSLENVTPAEVTAKATVGSMFILAHIISLLLSCSKSMKPFPEELLLQLLKTMVHPDVEVRLIAHHIFSVLLVPTHNQPRHELVSFRSGTPYEAKRPQTKSTPTFASAAALLEKLRKDKDGMKVEKHGNTAQYDYKQKEVLGEEWRQRWIQKNSPTFSKLSPIIARTARLAASADAESNILKLSEDQIAQLLSSFWIQACLPDNTPLNFEAISHSFNLTLVSSNIMNLNESIVRFFQLPLSLRNISLDPDYGKLPPSCKRTLFVLASAMLMSASKVYHVPDLYDLLNSSVSYGCPSTKNDYDPQNLVDPYVGIGDDQQLYVKSQVDVKEYGSSTDLQASLYLLSELREGVRESDKALLDIISQNLSDIVQLDKDELSKQLSEEFNPDDEFLFGPQYWHDDDYQQALFIPKESLSFDGDFFASGILEDDTTSESSVANLSHSVPKVSSSPTLSHVISVGQLLESALEKAGRVAGTAASTSPLPFNAMTSQCEALGTCTRQQLCNWLDHKGHAVKSSDKVLTTLPDDGRSIIRKISSDIGPRQESGGLPTEAWLTMRLPPSSPFDNFLRAVNRKGGPSSLRPSES